MKTYLRFIEYSKIWTSSERVNTDTLSSHRQFDLAHKLVFDLKEIGISDSYVDKNCVVYGKLLASKGQENAPKIGFIANLDTFPECSGKNVSPQIIDNYNGKDIRLLDNVILSIEEHPHLPTLKGQTLIVSSGDTLLGIDDKAGIAEILTALEALIQSNRPHGQISVAFLPDSEIGRAAKNFDVKKFDAQYAYTLDGWEVGEISDGNFNAIQAVIDCNGILTHTAKAKNNMINSQLIAAELISLLPQKETPSNAENDDGFFHLVKINGTVKNTKLIYNLRDFTYDGMNRKINILRNIEKMLNEKYFPGSVKINFIQQYKNMKNDLEKYPFLIKCVEEACKKVGIESKRTLVRGGTAGAHLSGTGIPCPNIGIGGYAYHTFYEHITVEAMDKVTRMLTELMAMYAIKNE